MTDKKNKVKECRLCKDNYIIERKTDVISVCKKYAKILKVNYGSYTIEKCLKCKNKEAINESKRCLQ